MNKYCVRSFRLIRYNLFMNGRGILKCILMFGVLWGCFCIGIYKTGSGVLVSDELGFVSTGRVLFDAFFIDGDWKGKIWFETFGGYGANNPRLGVFVLGAIHYCLSLFYDVAVDVDLLSAAFEKIIPPFRICYSVFSALSVVGIYFLIKKMVNKKTAAVACILFLINPIFLSVYDALVPDTLLLFFAVLSLICFLYFQKKQNYFWLILSSVLVGICISIRMYGFSVYLVFLMMLCFYFSKKSLKYFLFGTLIVAGIIICLNPLLHADFFYGLKMLTSGHVDQLTGADKILKISELKLLFTYPYVLFSGEKFSLFAIDEQPLNVSFWYLLATYVLVVRGIFVSFKQKYFLLIFLFLASHLWMIYPVLVLGNSVLIPKSFLLPALSVVLLVAVGLSSFVKTKKS